MGVKFSTVVIDAVDPPTLARFWSTVLDWHLLDIEEDGSIEIGPRDQQHVSMLFQPVAEPKRTKNRLHFDVNPHNSDQATELERLVELGARHCDVGQRDVTWFVLADPEGNEFCLLRSAVG